MNLVVMKNKQAVTSSLNIARNFEKRHDHILRDIENLKKDVPNFGEMFFKTTELDSYSRDRKVFLMNRDGFTLLAMGFTGKKAVDFKLKYIQAFNEMEERLKQNEIDTSQLSPELQLMNQMVKALANNELEAKQAKQMALEANKTANNISNIVSINNVGWREKVGVILKRIAKKWTGVEPYQSVIRLSYERLEERAGCRLNIRLNNRKERAIAQGMTKTYVNKINKLDVIAEEKRLVEIYIQVVKEMAIEFKVDVSSLEGVV